MSKVFRTREGFKTWAFENGLEAATESDTEMFVEHGGATLVVRFDPIDGDVVDATNHIENGPSQQMGGQNTLAVLKQSFLNCRPVKS